MKSRKAIVWLAILLILALVVFANRGRIHFDWGMFWLELRHIAWIHIAAGVALIYSTYWLRAARWSVFLSATKKVSPFVLVGPQFIGFTAVALFGRLADVIRPALVARRVQLPISTQIAVYTIERMFDLGAAALIFSGALLFAPRNLPHHEIFVHTGEISLAGTAFLAIFAVVVRVAGGAVASAVHAILHPLSASVADSVADKIRGFRDGLNAISSAQDFVIAALLSLTMWGLIGFAYAQTLHAFVTTPQLATISFSRTMLLMGASIGGSILQLPIIGWFTQIAVTAAAMSAFYGAPIEAATACGALLLFVTFLSIIPAGLISARLNHVSLRNAAEAAPLPEHRPATSFSPGDRVRVSNDFSWAKGATGTVAEPPDEVTAISGKWDGNLTRLESSSVGKHTVYWVWFDEPQHDADGDGPYRGGSIWEGALIPFSTKHN